MLSNQQEEEMNVIYKHNTIHTLGQFSVSKSSYLAINIKEAIHGMDAYLEIRSTSYGD